MRVLCTSEAPCFLGLQETKAGLVTKDWIEDIWGSKNFGFAQVPANGRSGGLISIWNTNSFTYKDGVGDERFIAIKGEWKGVEGEIVVVNVYGPHESRHKKALWDRLLSLMDNVNAAWCFLGDFNEVRNKEDRLNTQFQEKEADDFNDFITTATLIEIPLGGRKFTRISDDGCKFSKLDRFLVSPNFNEKWINLAAIALDRKESDHCPIVLKDISVDFGPKPFRVFDIWLEDPDVEKIVVEAWGKMVTSHRPDYQNIDEYRRAAMRWEVEAESRILDETEMREWMEARRNWINKDREKVSMLKQKSRIKWDVEGDENSKYFHAIIKRHNNKNNIRGMLVNEVRERPKFQNSNLGKLSADDASMLEAPFSESEGVIKEDVMRSVQWFWDIGEISKGCNASFVTLIPKTTDPIWLADFRPISLIESYYKILAKMLAERVKKVVGNVIGDVQNAFIDGRFILDGVLIANETINYLRKIKRKAWCLKRTLRKPMIR
ncbi:putative RNA-directed DNA polymerase, eukaryota [Tanacetum coccineum]